MKSRTFFLVVVSLALAGLSAYVVSALLARPVEVPDELTLYSLNPTRGRSDPSAARLEMFHDFEVLGKVEIKDAATRKRLMAALAEGIEKSDGSEAKCFNPRHGLRAVKDGHVVEYVICFECLQVEVILNGASAIKPTTRSPQPVFNEQVTKAGLPSAPRPSGEK